MLVDCPNGVLDACPDALIGQSSALFLTLINTLFAAKCSLNPERLYQRDHAPNLRNGDEFDFIVVGSGSSGSVVANRLSENKNWRVLVVEAGGYPTADSEIPSIFFSQQLTPNDWQYATEPSNYSCKGFKEGRCRWPRGKILGGTSAFNAMLYVRGNSRDYDTWEQEGNPGWGWNQALKYFQKSENTTADIRRRPLHGTKGYLRTSYIRAGSSYRNLLLNAAREAGLKLNRDEEPIGFYEALNTIENGKRHSAAKAFLASVKGRSNLYIALKTHVTKVLIKDDCAYGVEVFINGRLINLIAKKEVILSAGTINSPQILMLSGVGPRKHLRQLGIDVIQDSPVGQNLQDHPMSFGVMAKIDPSATPQRTPVDQLGDIYNYFSSNTGPLAGVDITNNIWFLNTRNTSSFPDIQIHFLYYPKNDNYLLPEIINKLQLNDISTKQILDENKRSDLLNILITLINPQSRGQILLRSPNPFIKPIIYHDYFSDPNGCDLQTMLQAFPWIQRFISTPTFQRYRAEFMNIQIPGCSGLGVGTEAYWVCNLMHLANSLYHPSGSCKMGPNPKNSVVDSRLRVHGIFNLRVIDGSIMPRITSGNTNAPCIMISEKGADLVKEDWANK